MRESSNSRIMYRDTSAARAQAAQHGLPGNSQYAAHDLKPRERESGSGALREARISYLSARPASCALRVTHFHAVSAQHATPQFALRRILDAI